MIFQLTSRIQQTNHDTYHAPYMNSTKAPALVIILLICSAALVNFNWYHDITPSTVNSPANSSILAACNNNYIGEYEILGEYNNEWLPSTSVGCAPQSNGTLVITLDDQSHLPSWWLHRQQFIDEEIKLTLFIDRTYHLNETEWFWLETFHLDGHEIGIHSKNHLSVIHHLESGDSIDSYVSEQIVPEIEAFHSHGIFPTAFAYPYGHRTSEFDEVLLKHFNILRGTNRWVGNNNLPPIISEYGNNVISAKSMDREYNPRSEIESDIVAAAESGMALVTYGHRLDSNDNSYHTTEPADLFFFVELAKSLGMKLATISDLTTPPHQEGLEDMYSYLRGGDIEIANRMLENCWTLPRFEEVCFEGDYPTWNEDPFDENYWRFVFYSLRPLSNLLYAWELTGNESYRDHLIALIHSFSVSDDSSPWIYEHHADKHGAAFRAMVLTEIRWALEHDNAINSEEVMILESLIHHTGTYLMQSENFESGYNHGFNQAAGLLVLSTNHPWLEDSLDWDITARVRLNQMMEEAVDSNGVMIESSPYYHNYILLKIGEIIRWGEVNNIPLPNSLSTKFPMMLDYATDVAYPDLSLPLIGASIPGLGLNSNSFASYESLHARLSWIRSSGERGWPGVDNPNLFHTAYYPESGHAILRSSWSNDTINISHAVIDSGPYRTGHSDYDHFGFTWYKGEPILIDPGLYSYESGAKRDYFHGTSSHNVILVDQKNQPENYEIGDTWIFEKDDWGAIISSIYIDDWHWTRAVISIGNEMLLVYDEIAATSSHRFDLLWHLAPDLQIEVGETGYIITDNQQGQIAQLHTLSSRNLAQEIIVGQNEPLQGWFADGYESMIPAPVIQQTTTGVGFTSASLWSTSDNPTSISGDLSRGNSSLELHTFEQLKNVIIKQDNSGLWTIDVN